MKTKTWKVEQKPQKPPPPFKPSPLCASDQSTKVPPSYRHHRVKLFAYTLTPCSHSCWIWRAEKVLTRRISRI